MQTHHRAYLKRQFDGLVYVYAYVDPWTDEPFYVGQGSGDRDEKHLRRRGTPFYERIREIKSYGLNPLAVRLLTGLTREEATRAVRFFVLSLGCQGCSDNPGPLLNRNHGITSIRAGCGVSRIDRNGRVAWVATFYETRIGESATYEDALAIRLAEEKRSRGMSRRAWEENWRKRKTAKRHLG